MISHGFKRLFALLLFVFWFQGVQELAGQEVNYKLVPNLQQMKDSSPTPDFTLPDPAGKKVSILAVDVKDKKTDALAFIKELKLSFPVVFDPEGKVGLLYGAWGLPAPYLIGPKGEGLARMWGPADWSARGQGR